MISLDDLIESGRAVGAATFGPVFGRNFGAISYDSRTLRPGDLFIAVRTDRADGHDFVEHACSRGAAAVLVDHPVDVARFGASCIVVRDTRASLISWARFVLARQAPDVIAIAGAVGKTSTEAAIVRVLSTGDAGDESIFQNGNLNDLFGLPVALGGLEPSHQLAVLELASDRAGEIDELVQIARPRTAVVTNVAMVYRDTLGGLDRLLEEMMALVAAIPPDGVVILNGDDGRVRSLASRVAAPVLLYGLSPGLDICARDVVVDREGLSFTITQGDEEQQVRSFLLGRHNVYTLLAAAAVAVARGQRLPEIAEKLEGLRPLPGRLRPLSGLNGALLLDDTQSASPCSLGAALDTLSLFPRRRVVVLGEVSDLDLQHEAGDAALVEPLAATADLLVTLGPGAESLGRAVEKRGLPAEQHISVSSAVDAGTALRPLLCASDTVLIKGSEAARMERVVEQLLARPSEGPAVLVRQDPGWKQRVFLPRERSTWIELDLAALARNVELACELAGPATGLVIVLKADAYGHGAVPVARTAFLHGASMGAVACLSEALALREAGIRAPLLLLGHTPAWQARDIVRHELTATLYSRDLAVHLSRAATAAGAAPVPVHIKVDTGMSRLGLLPDEVPDFLAGIKQLPGLAVEGIFTHLATADEGPDSRFALQQIQRFRSLIGRLRNEGHEFRYVHAANSAGLLNGFGAGFNLVRVGILAYGLNPSETTPCPDGFRPVLSFKTRIAQVKSLPAGACVSYGCSFVTERPSRIAVIPVGYGDGFRRAPAGWGEALVRGHRVPIVGNVCMDMTMLDVTDTPAAKEGDEVVLIGAQGDERITADEIAQRLGTINYEVVTQILPRVPRTVP